MKLIHHQPFTVDRTLHHGNAGRARAPSVPPSAWASQSLGHRASPSSGAGACAPIRLQPVNATPSTVSSADQPPKPTAVELPASQEAATEAAVHCLTAALQPLLLTAKQVKTAKGFSGSRGPSNTTNRFGIEIPVLDASAKAALDLTNLVLSLATGRLKQRGGGYPAWTVVHAREDVAQLAKGRAAGAGGGVRVLGLREACQQPQLGGLLVVVEPAVSDVALVEQLLDDVWAGPAAVVLNPAWSQQGVQVPREYERLVASIVVLYSFLPCAIQGLLGRKDGAVLRAVDPAAPPATSAWRILLKQRDEFVQVGAMSRRPTSSDLELAFLNASAASSPLTKTAKFIRGLMPGGGGEKDKDKDKK